MTSNPVMRPNVEFRIELLKTNSGLAKSTLQQKTRGYTQKKKSLRQVLFKKREKNK